MNANRYKGLTNQEKWFILMCLFTLTLTILLMSDIPFFEELTIKVGEKFSR